MTQLGITQVGGSESQEGMIEPSKQPDDPAIAGAADNANSLSPNSSRTLSVSRDGRSPAKRHDTKMVRVQQTVTASVSAWQEELDAQERRKMQQPWDI